MTAAPIKQEPPDMFGKLDVELQTTNSIRDKLITMLTDCIMNSEVDITKMNSEARESYMSLMRELNNTMKSRDSNHLNFVKLKLQKDGNTINSNYADMVSEMLMRLNLNQQPIQTGVKANPHDTTTELDSVIAANNLPILDTELEMDA